MILTFAYFFVKILKNRKRVAVMPFTPVLERVQFMRTDYQQKPLTFVAGRPFHSLTLRKSGRVMLAGGGTLFTSEAGSLTYVPAGCDYHTEVLEDGFMYTMHFYADVPLLDTPATEIPPLPLALENLFSGAVDHYAANGCDLAAFSAAYQLLVAALPIFSPEQLFPPRRMRECKAFLDDNIADSTLRVGKLAERCGISEVYFRQEFKRFYGKAPLEYLKERRIELAKMLLDTGLYTVTEVAFRAGFENSSYFSAEFRRMVGKSPREYRDA